MKESESYLEHIGLITIQNLKDFLRNARYYKIRSVLVNQVDMDKLATECRESYRDKFFEPFVINGVRVKEDLTRTTPPGRIRVVLWGSRS